MKKQKRLLIVLLACIFIASLLLTGCGPSEDPTDADPSGEGTGEVTKGLPLLPPKNSMLPLLRDIQEHPLQWLFPPGHPPC